jgi:hypothetical protein
MVSGKNSLIQADALLEQWASRIKDRLPEGCDLVASLQHEKQGFFVSFRAETESGIFIAEARDASAERAVSEAGASMYQRIESSLPAEKPSFKDRIRDLFSEAS